jgi:DNA-binding transcriptional regulator YiaG
MTQTETQPLDLKNIAAYRKSLGMNQTDFWHQFSVTQSGGSRYEAERNMPDPVAMLVLLYSLDLVSKDTLKMVYKLIPRQSNDSDNNA